MEVSSLCDVNDEIVVISRKVAADETDVDFDDAMKNVNVFMSDVFVEAEEALAHAEVPVGCVFVYEGRIIGRGRNKVNEYGLFCRL